MIDDCEGAIPQEAKDLTPLRGTVERLWRNVIELEECTMSRSGSYRVEQDDGEIVVYREQYERHRATGERGVIYHGKSEVGRWDYREVEQDD